MKNNCFVTDEIRSGVFRINECGVFCYLITGQRRALLIDTGTGIGDLAAEVARLTDKPVTVAATHGHPDHIGGRRCFKEMYISGQEKFVRIYGSLAVRKMSFGKDTAAKYGLKKSDVRRGGFKTKLLPLNDDTVFDLGGRTVSCLSTPGHTAGSMIFLLHEDRLMFTGDNVCRALWMFLPGAESIEEWLVGARKIAELTESYTPYCAHEVGLQDPQHIRGLVAAGIELVERTAKNSRSRKKAVYPEDYKDFGIIYRGNRVLTVRKHEKTK